MPTYQIWVDKLTKPFYVKADKFEADGEFLRLRAGDDLHTVALIPTAKLLYILEHKPDD